MPYLRDVGQMFGLEVHRMPFIVNFSLPLAIGKQPEHLKVIGGFL